LQEREDALREDVRDDDIASLWDEVDWEMARVIEENAIAQRLLEVGGPQAYESSIQLLQNAASQASGATFVPESDDNKWGQWERPHVMAARSHSGRHGVTKAGTPAEEAYARGFSVMAERQAEERGRQTKARKAVLVCRRQDAWDAWMAAENKRYEDAHWPQPYTLGNRGIIYNSEPTHENSCENGAGQHDPRCCPAARRVRSQPSAADHDDTATGEGRSQHGGIQRDGLYGWT
jgi:hypothetical protein